MYRSSSVRPSVSRTHDLLAIHSDMLAAICTLISRKCTSLIVEKVSTIRDLSNREIAGRIISNFRNLFNSKYFALI